MDNHIQCDLELPKAFWLNIVISIIAQVMSSRFIPENHFGNSERLPISAATQLAAKFKGSLPRREPMLLRC